MMKLIIIIYCISSKWITMLINAYILILLLSAIAQAGRILNGDLWVDYANAESMTEISFSFMLQNSIDENDYIKVALPFPLHSSLVPAYPAKEGLSIPSGLEVTYQEVDGSSNIQSTMFTCQVLTETIDSSIYFIRFYDTDRKTLLPIPKDQWYYLKFKILDTDPLQYQKSNSILQIQISTVSSVWSNAMIYDDNLAFNYFQLASVPTESIILQTSPYNFAAAGEYLLTQAEYSLYMDVNMAVSSYQFNENIKLMFFISKANTFKWNGTCSSVAKNNSPRISALDSSLYTCNIDYDQNIMTVVLTPAALTLQTKYRFTVDVINPPIVIQDVDIVVKAIKEVSNVILSVGTDAQALKTNEIYVTQQEIFIGWGLRPDNLLPFDARIFRGNAATPTYMPYNSLTTKFRISQSTSPAVELKVQISIPSETNAFVLPNGYTHNLPAFPDKEVRCVVESATDTIERKISCTGVGGLEDTKLYEIGWKMFFPYDNYESDIDCTEFGLLSVYTAESITEDDNVFILGRGDEFLEYMKSSPDYYVIGRNTSYISYMKTFANLNMMVLSSDFQDFLKYPEQVIVTNRPHSYTNKQFNDVYLIGQNLAFMTYLEQFNDLYVAYKLKSNSDIIKGYHSSPLISHTMPKNTLTIKSSNSKDWSDFSTNTQPLVSSSTGSSPSDGLRIENGVNQSIFFSMKAPYDEVTSVDGVELSIEDNWGMKIMMNPKISLNDAAVVLTETSAALTATAQTVNSGFNKYTLITLNGATPGQLQTSFPLVAAKTTFSLFPFLIEDFSSLFADDANFDIMIATFDGVDGPRNRITENGFFLINGFTLMASQNLNTLSSGFVGYAHSSQMDGSLVPTMLRLKGTIAGSTNFHRLNIFFDRLTPYFENYYNGDIFCHNTDGAPYCKFEKGAEANAEEYNYHTFSRIEIKLTNPGTAFDILIPVTAPGNPKTYFYLGYTEIDPTTGRIFNRYMEVMKPISHSGSYSTSGSFGPVVNAAKVGEVLAPMELFASHSGINVNVDSSDLIGGAFIYFAEWNYFNGATLSNWNNGPCYKMDYLLYKTNYDAFLTGSTFTYSYKKMWGVVCLTDTGNSISGKKIQVSTSSMPTKWGLKFPGYGAYSQNTGNMVAVRANVYSASAAETITDVNTVITPVMGVSMTRAIGRWVIPLPVGLSDDVEILMTATGSSNMAFLPLSGTCGVYIDDLKLPISCIFTTSPTEVDFILVINEPDLLPVGTEMSIMHYGLSTNTSNNAMNFDLKCYSLVNTNSPGANDLIFSAAAVPFRYGATDLRYEGPSTISLASFMQVSNNKGAVTAFNFSFTIISKGMYITNRVRINLGQYYTDNSASQISPKCKIYTYSTTGSLEYSHDWAAIDTSLGLNKLEFWPEKDSDSTNLTYTVKCINFVATPTSSPTGISARVVNTSSDLTGEILTTSPIVLTTLPALTKTNSISASKKFTVPSTLMEIQFTIVSPGITVDSILYIGFPPYYSTGLGPTVLCYSSMEILCKVSGRELKIQYLGTYAEGVSFAISVTGISQPVNYNSGTFYFVIDDDDNPNTVLSSGTFVDTVSASVLDTQNFPAFQILSFTQSSNYLREENIEVTMDFYIPSTLNSITVGQYLFMVFPPNFGDVLRFVTPTCTLNIRGNTLKNYISSCEVKGLRLKMPFLDDLILGSVYTLTVNGLINPTNPSSNVYKYCLEITSSSGTSIIARSFSPHANFEMPIFIANPYRESLNYYTVEDGLITELSSTVNVQSEEVYISSGTDLNESFYSRNVYLQSLNNLYSIPSSINLLSGANPFPIRFSGLNSGVNFIYFQKTGDGSFYSNLPPLTLSINKNYFTALSFAETTFSLPVAAVNTNYSIAVNLPFELYPMSETNVTVTLSSSVGISLRNNPTVIQFYPQKTSATINLYINDATLWLIGTTTNIVFTPSSATTYASGISIPVTAVNPVAALPTATVTSSTNELKKASFDITCSEYGRFVYHLSRKYGYNQTSCALTVEQIGEWVLQASIDGLRVQETYYQCEDQIGQVNIATPSVPQELLIEDLYTSTDYILAGYCISQIGTKSELTSADFSTQSNGGVISKMDFNFEAQLSAAQKIKLVCALALLFEVNYFKVSTADGYYCSELLSSRLLQASRLKQEEKQQQLQSQIGFESSSPVPSNNLWKEEMVPLTRVLTSTPNRVEVYFGVNTDKNTDNSAAQISNLSISQTEIINEIQNIVGLPNFVSLTQSVTSVVGPNDLTGSYRVDTGPNYVYVEGMTLTNDGLIYVIIGKASEWSRAPLISEIKQGSGPNGLPPVYYRVLAYRDEEPYTSYAAYRGVGNEALKLYIMPSDDNPFDTANFGRIRGYTIEAQVPTWETRLVVMGMMVLMAMVL